MPDRLEIEAKFPISNPEAMRTALTRAGAISQGQHNEYNIRLDDLERRLTEQSIVLRLRRTQVDGELTYLLTLKTEAQTEKGAIRARREVELNVSDLEAMLVILEVLGYTPYWRYEKRREVFTWRRAEAVLDELPYGWFMEIEGREEDIRALAERLELDPEDAIPYSYGEIFQHVCDNLDLVIEELTFETFSDIHVPPDAYYPPR